MATPPDHLLDHDYDGIREFDNPLPKWWVYLFYGTIVFALVYVPYYHFGPGSLPREQWAADMNAWWQQHPPPKLANNEELEAMAQDPSFVAAGESIFKIRCISCHAVDGGGLVGPNLTDDFTIYGYERSKIVAVIFHGTKNGMLAWKDQLSLEQIYQVGAYVYTLRGTTPAKPKAPEGVAIVDPASAPEPEPASKPAPDPETPPVPSDEPGAVGAAEDAGEPQPG
jgi:cytochrome c oxidase cbb3-type subunit 3